MASWYSAFACSKLPRLAKRMPELVQRLPLWIEYKWEIIPLETWDHHLDFITQYRVELGLKYLIDSN